MSTKKFEYCYSHWHKCEFSIDEMQKYYDDNENIDDFREDMWCPECRQAGLRFTRKTLRAVAYFSTLAQSRHCNDCSYNYDYIKKVQLEKYINNLSDQQIADKMDSVFGYLLRQRNNKPAQNVIDNPDANPILVKVSNTQKTQKYNAIRQKSLNTFLDQNRLKDEIYIFYGKNVKLKKKIIPYKDNRNSETKEVLLYLLEIYTLSENKEYKYKAKIFLGNKELNVDEEACYHIVIIGNLDDKYNLQINLVRKNNGKLSIKFEKVDELI